MDDTRRARIQESWGRIAGEGEVVAEAFYRRLFELDPRVRDLFAAADMESQPAKFMAMLGEVVRLVQDPERFQEVLEASGRRHAGYGVLPRHYQTVGEALLWAVNHALPQGLDPDTREAWAEAYTRMSFLMQRGAT